MKIKKIYIEEVRENYIDKENIVKNYIFTVILKKGLHKKRYKFLTNLPYFSIAYVSDYGYYNAPNDKEENRKILILAYGELKKRLAELELEYYFKQQDREEEERRILEEREKESRIIKVGEQVTIEKYLKNK